MKKLITLVAVAGMFSFYACGPSAEEKAAMEKAKQDSIAAVEAANAAAEAAKQQAMQDSIAAVEKLQEKKLLLIQLLLLKKLQKEKEKRSNFLYDLLKGVILKSLLFYFIVC